MARKNNDKNNDKKGQEICFLCGEPKKMKNGMLLCMNEECFAGKQNLDDARFEHLPFS